MLSCLTVCSVCTKSFKKKKKQSKTATCQPHILETQWQPRRREILATPRQNSFQILQTVSNAHDLGQIASPWALELSAQSHLRFQQTWRPLSTYLSFFCVHLGQAADGHANWGPASKRHVTCSACGEGCRRTDFLKSNRLKFNATTFLCGDGTRDLYRAARNPF